MAEFDTAYVLSRGERAIFGEIYFPKRAVYQGAIFDALRHGHDEGEVIRYLRDNAKDLLQELTEHKRLFDPHYYDATQQKKTHLTIKGARQRFDMYKSSFKGWSVYSVDGVFFDQHGKMYEEATQVVRLMFRFESFFTNQALVAKCQDVLRSILFWSISRQARLSEQKPWSRAAQTQFTEEHKPWPKKKLGFVGQHFAGITREVAKWIDDVGLFVFGYLVRKFSENVLTERLYEEESN